MDVIVANATGEVPSVDNLLHHLCRHIVSHDRLAAV